jgi:hypothetical protein
LPAGGKTIGFIDKLYIGINFCLAPMGIVFRREFGFCAVPGEESNAALIDSRAAVEDQRSAALSLLTSAFEDEDAEEDEYEMRNAKREVPGENARKRS